MLGSWALSSASSSAILGIGALVAGGIAFALAALAAVLLLGHSSSGLPGTCSTSGPRSGYPSSASGIVLATLFLVVGWFPKVVITAIVFLIDPSWFHGSARVHWPENHLSQLRRDSAAGLALPPGRMRMRRDASGGTPADADLSFSTLDVLYADLPVRPPAHQGAGPAHRGARATARRTPADRPAPRRAAADPAADRPDRGRCAERGPRRLEPPRLGVPTRPPAASPRAGPHAVRAQRARCGR